MEELNSHWPSRYQIWYWAYGVFFDVLFLDGTTSAYLSGW